MTIAYQVKRPARSVGIWYSHPSRVKGRSSSCIALRTFQGLYDGTFSIIDSATRMEVKRRSEPQLLNRSNCREQRSKCARSFSESCLCSYLRCNQMPRVSYCQLVRGLSKGSSHKDRYYILRPFELCSIGIKKDDSRLVHSK